MTAIVTPTTVHIRADGTHVVVIKDGRTIFDMPYDAALQLARAIMIKAREAEEWAHADQIAFDGAILLRAGVPLGLTNHKDIRKEIGKIAAWDSSLRRYMPGGIKSQELFGTPQVIRHEPIERHTSLRGTNKE